MSVQSAIDNGTIFECEGWGLRFKFVDGWAAGCAWHKVEFVEDYMMPGGINIKTGDQIWVCEGQYEAKVTTDDGEVFNLPHGEHGGNVITGIDGWSICNVIDELEETAEEAELEEAIGSVHAWLDTVAGNNYNVIVMFEDEPDASRAKMLEHSRPRLGKEWTTRTVLDIDIDDDGRHQVIVDMILEKYKKMHIDKYEPNVLYYMPLSESRMPVTHVKTYAANEWIMNVHAEGYADGLRASVTNLDEWINNSEAFQAIVEIEPYYFTGGSFRIISATRNLKTGKLDTLVEVDDEAYNDSGTRKPAVPTEKRYADGGRRRTYWVTAEL